MIREGDQLGIPTVGNEAVAHPTQKPVAVYQRLIKMTTAPGDTVLAPFAGSGTLGVAANMAGRNAIMIEKDSEYIEVVRRRMKGKFGGAVEVAA